MRTDQGERNHRGFIELDVRTTVVKLWLIKLPYWLGIAADALWAIALFFPVVFGVMLTSYSLAGETDSTAVDF